MPDTRSDPVAMFKDAFGPNSTDTCRAAAIGLMMQNPQGFVTGLADVLGSFTSTQLLTKIADDASAPEPLRKAAAAECMRLGSSSLENKRLDRYHLEQLLIGWGESSVSNDMAPQPVAKKANPLTVTPDAEMQNKYHETVIRPHSQPAPARKALVPTGFLLFALVRTSRS